MVKMTHVKHSQVMVFWGTCDTVQQSVLKSLTVLNVFIFICTAHCPVETLKLDFSEDDTSDMLSRAGDDFENLTLQILESEGEYLHTPVLQYCIDVLCRREGSYRV